MARRNPPNYSVSILDRLNQRAEARVQRVQHIRELGGLPPQPEVTPQLWDEGDYHGGYYYRRFPQEDDRTLDYILPQNRRQGNIDTDAMTDMLLRHFNEPTTRRRMEGIWSDTESVHNDSYIQTFQHFQEFNQAKIYEQLLKTFTLESVRKSRLADKEGITNKDAQFLLDKNND